MKIDKKIVERAATLSRIEMEPENVEPMVRFFRDIIGHFKVLEKCDTTGVDPFSSLEDEPCPLRGDGPVRWDIGDEALDAAPHKEGRFFQVPAIGGEGGPDEV
jgi:aspartyl-tRNA(Asn)/glutamyl-tRNA(Gln) amidotransferase subunit C